MDPAVFEAAESGDFERIKVLIENDTKTLDQFRTPQRNDTVLHLAVRSEKQSFAEKAIEMCPNLLTTPNSDGETPLHAAAKIKSLAMVKFILASDDIEKAIARAKDKNGDTALHVGVRSGDVDVTTVLVKADVGQLRALNAAGESVLFLAVEGGFLDITKVILKTKCEPLCNGSMGMNALHAAVIRTYDATIVEHHVPDLSLENFRRLMRGFFLHIEEFFGAVSHNTSGTEIIELLLQIESQGIELVEKQESVMNWTPLHFAAYLGHVEATKMILQHQNGTSVDPLKDKEGMSALHVAAKQGRVLVMKEIIDQRPQVCELVDNKGRTILHVAVEHNMLVAVRYILGNQKLEFLLNARDNEGNTAMHLAVDGREKRWIMKVLVDDVRVDKKATNFKYLKAVDILRVNQNIGELIRCWFTKKLEKQGGRESLQSIVHRVEHTNQITENNNKSLSSSSNFDHHHDHDKPSPVHTVLAESKTAKSQRLKKISDTHLLVATLIATITFAAAFTIPGGYAQDPGPDKGMAVLSKRPFFKMFVIADWIAFYCSALSVLLLFVSSVEHNYHLLLRFTRVAAALTYVSILGMIVAFASGLKVVMPSSSILSYFILSMGGFCVLLFIVACL